MKNYQCKKCGILIKTARQPNAFNCRVGNYHDWNDLGEVGCENYRCKKCGTYLYRFKQEPGSIFKYGLRCRKCGATYIEIEFAP